MPREGYTSAGSSSLPDEYVEAIKKLLKDEGYKREMRGKGHIRVTRALVIRMALRDYLKGKGIDIDRVSEAEGK